MSKEKYSISIGMKILLAIPMAAFLGAVLGLLFGFIHPFSAILFTLFFAMFLLSVAGFYFSNTSYSFASGSIEIFLPFQKANVIHPNDIDGFYFEQGDNAGTFVFVLKNSKKVKITSSGKLKNELVKYVESITPVVETNGYESIKKHGLDIFGATKKKFRISELGVEIAKTGETIGWDKISDVHIQKRAGLVFYSLISKSAIVFNDYNTKGNRGIEKFVRERI